ncbi:hypothetical protein DPMN_059101 [Dreissena polymorpha]|uniref:Uncharacterized protein n=1 Tax=Dreissena polymorpha TaxID=45954 RepID=A0A9D4C3B0_DREPO|nr:hypothetical protein DPMN_059101 [Dreissena polymorpha]
MRVVSNDSKVLTVINRRRGEKGYRLLQGDNLRSLFLTLIQMEVKFVSPAYSKHPILDLCLKLVVLKGKKVSNPCCST